MKIMIDDDNTMDSVSSDEERMFSPRNRQTSPVLRRRSSRSDTLRSSHASSSNSRSTRNSLNVRRSTRNRMQTYDNLNTSWILGTQTLKGYPMFQNQVSSSDKEMADEVPERKEWVLRNRVPLRSRENHPPSTRSSRHSRERMEMHTPNNRELRDRSDRELKSDHSKDRSVVKENEDKIETKSKYEVRANNDEKETRTRKSDSPLRSRDGPVTRNSGIYHPKGENEKDVKGEDEDDSSQESEKAENNNNSDNEDGFQDMYSRVKRTRRATTRRQIQRRNEDSDMSESSEDMPRKYSLRQKKPTIDRFQASAEQPVRRSIRVFRSALNNSIRRRKHRSKSTSSSDSSDSEHQRYNKKKGKKTRQTAIPQGGPHLNGRADINPIKVDTNIRFSEVGGLESHIQCLKEMVVFPMVYPDIFDKFHATPPKGVLFHGPPGTGKTLIARALANECSQGNRKVAFFMRKGADCLSKWVGESERQLRLLFEQAQQMKPSIIFFDEIDGLAPVRSTKQDQIHASIVSTLLALMDGLSDRGEVIVIGATNRIDAIDPALRRPGRFDRELFFPLPAMKERLEILKIHVSKWENPPEELLLETFAERAIGYCGSDLKALCTEAVLQALRRTYPQIYKTNNRLLLQPDNVEVKKKDFMQASSMLVPASHRVSPCPSKKLPAFMEPLLGPALGELISTLKEVFPPGVNPALARVKFCPGVYRPRLLISWNEGMTPYLVQALLHCTEHLPVQTLDVSALFAESARSPEETCVQVFNEAVRNVPSIIYVRSIDQWWPLVPETVKAVFLCRIAALDPSLPILILATSNSSYDNLPAQIQSLFEKARNEVFVMNDPTDEQRSKFFRPIFMVQSMRPVQVKRNKVQDYPELPLAPDPVPKKLNEKEKKILHDKEEISLRELRIFLREICAKLARNRQFFMFTKPVDTEEVPDYNTIIKQPMDLETMMTKIDMHCYLCAREFLDDIDLICRNALEYNPERDPADKLIRHRACSLRDNAYALIKAELDSDFEDKCREISKNRNKKAVPAEKNETATKETASAEGPIVPEKNDKKEAATPSSSLALNGRRFPSSRKRKIPAWARGYVKKPHKKKKISFDDSTPDGKANSTEDLHAIDLAKLQEFEGESNNVVNGHVTSFDQSESDRESHLENSKDEPTTESLDDKNDKSEKKEAVAQQPGAEIATNEVNHVEENSASSSSSRRESLDELSFAIDCDPSLEHSEESDKIVVDKGELENALRHTVDVTKNFCLDILCDIYVRLSRCVGRFAYTANRKSLPKDLLNELKKFEESKATTQMET